MPPKKSDRTKIRMGLLLLLALVVVAGGVGLKNWMKSQSVTPSGEEVADSSGPMPVEAPKVLDYGQLENNEELKALMDQRKAALGLDKGIDMIVQSDESVKIGNTTVSMQEIRDKIRLQRGAIVEKDLAAQGGDHPENKIESFGVHVVQPQDNIWNIHFQFLKDYFAHRGVSLSPLADEPNQRGRSSGVGKILKFSESIVYIYNVTERKLDMDLNLLAPFSKIVVYSMTDVFALLDQIDYSKVNRIQFDGETIWLPNADS
jgi:hypothetical protein